MAEIMGSVTRRSEREIERLAGVVRRELGVSPASRLSMQPVLEFHIEDMVEGAYLQVISDGELNGAEGRTDWHQPVISLSASTYAKLQTGNPRARMTAAHELGHLLMHTRQPVFHYRTTARDRRVDPEWQANQFAASLLMPANAFRKMRTVSQAMKAFGVTKAAALYRARSLSVRIFDDTVNACSSKKKGHGLIRTP